MSRELDAMKALESEDRILIKNARLLFDSKPSVSTLRRYVTRGIRNHDCKCQVFLEAYREGWTIITSVQAVQRFRERINGGK